MHRLNLTTIVLVAAITAVIAIPAAAKSRGINGEIVTSVVGDAQVYTVNPDGTDQQLVATDSETGQWSPDGTRISLFDRVLNPDDGSVTDLNLSAQYPDLFLPCGVWSPDGKRLACEGGFIDPTLQGIYTVRSSDGGGLRQITSNPGGDDCPSDYSPDGKRLVFTRQNADGGLALDTVKLDGKGLRQITPPGMNFDFCNGSWSPQGNEILFSAHVPDLQYASTIWVVHSDGSGLRQIPVPGCGGLLSSSTFIGCSGGPSWSPDGKKIVFSRLVGATGQRDLYTVNVDGSGLFQVTHTPDIAEDYAGDWGTHPLAR
jgi:Tol biopolymer transport system component